MFALHSRNVVLAALLAMAVSAPASASESAANTQQTVIGQVATNSAAVEASPIVAQESFATETKGRIEAPRARRKMTELRPSLSGVRRSGEHPLILGIAY